MMTSISSSQYLDTTYVNIVKIFHRYFNIQNMFLPCGLPPAILNGSDFRRNSNKCPVNLVSKNGLKCCCCPENQMKQIKNKG